MTKQFLFENVGGNQFKLRRGSLNENVQAKKAELGKIIKALKANPQVLQQLSGGGAVAEGMFSKGVHILALAAMLMGMGVRGEDISNLTKPEMRDKFEWVYKELKPDQVKKFESAIAKVNAFKAKAKAKYDALRAKDQVDAADAVIEKANKEIIKTWQSQFPEGHPAAAFTDIILFSTSEIDPPTSGYPEPAPDVPIRQQNNFQWQEPGPSTNAPAK